MLDYTLRQTATPALQPVTLAEARAHLRSDPDDDGLVAIYLAAAVDVVQEATGRALLPQDWELRLSWFPCAAILLPFPPLISVASVTTVASDGAETVLDASSYQVLTPTGPTAPPGAVAPATAPYWAPGEYGQYWGPGDYAVAGTVRIAFRAGYASPGAVPPALRAAVLLRLGDLYTNREAASAAPITDNPTIARLLAPYRVLWL